MEFRGSYASYPGPGDVGIGWNRFYNDEADDDGPYLEDDDLTADPDFDEEEQE